MTLVIAGHDLQKSTAMARFQGHTRGLFVVADSTITNGNQTVLSGFKKIYGVPIKVYKPYFVGGHFRNYHYLHSETQCFIAFAGSTLTAQHVLNGITNHLTQMRIGFDSSKGGYHILMECQRNALTQRPGIDQWDEDMFTDSDMSDLLSGEVVRDTVKHAIEGALAGARVHKLDEVGYRTLLTQYVLGTYCEVNKRHRLFSFLPRLLLDTMGVVDGIAVDVSEIDQGEICVLGMTGFESAAKAEYQRAYNAGENVARAMFTFINGAIDQIQALGKREIDRPSLLKGFHRGTLTEVCRSK